MKKELALPQMVKPYAFSFFVLLTMMLTSISYASSTCSCSSSAVTSCENFCANKGQTYKGITCTPTGGSEGYCYCSKDNYGIAPGSQCSS